MPNHYDNLYAWIWSSFSTEPFTAAEFRATFPSPAPAKVLSDLHRLGYVTAVRRGVYRCEAPEVRVGRLVEREADHLALAARSDLPYAYDRDTAVTLWSGGTYWTGFTRGFRPVHVRVRQADLPAWKAFFRGHRARMTVDGARETLFGVAHVLHPAPEVPSVNLNGAKVIPLPEALAYARARPYLYAPVFKRLEALLRRRHAA